MQTPRIRARAGDTLHLREYDSPAPSWTICTRMVICVRIAFSRRNLQRRFSASRFHPGQNTTSTCFPLISCPHLSASVTHFYIKRHITGQNQDSRRRQPPCSESKFPLSLFRYARFGFGQQPVTTSSTSNMSPGIRMPICSSTFITLAPGFQSGMDPTETWAQILGLVRGMNK